MKVDEYFRRIGVIKSNISADLTGLGMLQKQHLLNVPFENLDIHWKTPIVLDLEKIFQKIVGRGRGGFCYELNGLFYQLISETGFRSRMVSARVSNGTGGFGAEFDHLAILVRVGNKDFLTDVGFGDFAAEPLEFVLDAEQADANGTFLIRKFDGQYFEVVKKTGGDWKSEYIFSERERDLGEFAAMCEFHQTSPESHFTSGKLCSLMIRGGRKTLTDRKFIETVNGQKSEAEVGSEDEFLEILEREFLIKAP